MNELEKLRNDSLVREKVLSNDISSFNFSSKAFFDKAWHDETIRARGLFVDTKSGHVAARSYNKFFNFGEMPETQMDSLKENLVFPLIPYLKENGFLGLVFSRDGQTLQYASKSTNEGTFAGYLQDIAEKTLSEGAREKMATFLFENESTLVVEVIDPVNDPHIVKYYTQHLVALDIIKNDFDFIKMDYETLWRKASGWGLDVKFDFEPIEDFYQFEDIINTIENNPYDYKFEGFVFTDQNGFMFKYKTPWYRGWKMARGIMQQMFAGKKLSDIKRIDEKLTNIKRMTGEDIRESLPQFVEVHKNDEKKPSIVDFYQSLE
jgi:tRNA splicing ligase